MNDDSARTIARLSDLDLMPRRVYRLRMLGMGLATPALATVLYENSAAWPSWAMMIFTCALWPQLALVIARRSRSPYRAELRNLMFDSALVGLWVSLMHFNLLPSILLLTLTTADKISTGIRGLWLWSLPGLLIALLAGAGVTGFAFQPETSMLVLLACMPVLLIHTVAVSLTNYHLVRRVQRQNRQLDELNRHDPLTGLASRGHWQARAEEMLQASHLDDKPASLLLIDIDQFKAINDRFGHAAGDAVLERVAEVIRGHLGRNDLAGRIGGDELALALHADAEHTRALAERIRQEVAALELQRLNGSRISVSIGFAQAHKSDPDLREWMDGADRALYRAKESGRNRVEGRSLRPPPRNPGQAGDG